MRFSETNFKFNFKLKIYRKKMMVTYRQLQGILSYNFLFITIRRDINLCSRLEFDTKGFNP